LVYAKTKLNNVHLITLAKMYLFFSFTLNVKIRNKVLLYIFIL